MTRLTQRTLKQHLLTLYTLNIAKGFENIAPEIYVLTVSCQRETKLTKKVNMILFKKYYYYYIF